MDRARQGCGLQKSRTLFPTKDSKILCFAKIKTAFEINNIQRRLRHFCHTVHIQGPPLRDPQG